MPISRLPALQASDYLHGGIERPQRLVVRTETEWRTVWTDLWRRRTPPVPLPELDFDRQMVLVVTSGAQPSGGYSIHVDRVTDSPSGMRVLVRSVSPGPNCIVTQAITHPFDLAIVRRHEGDVDFQEQSEQRSCS